MTNQNKLDTLYMDIAKRLAEMSYAQRKKVGGLLVKGDNIISMGWNGTPTGFDNVCEDENNVTKPECLHAELNLISKAARSTISTEGATLYVTISPCVDCAKLIIQSHIVRVVYYEEYRMTDGIELLKKANIKIEKYPVSPIFKGIQFNDMNYPGAYSGDQVLLLHKIHGVIEGWFSAGYWSEDTPICPREYSGDMWVLGDDISQEDVEIFPDGSYHSHNIIGWLPRNTLQLFPKDD